MKKLVGLFTLVTIVLFTSCLKGDNISIFNNLFGTFELVQISGEVNPVLLIRLDADGSLIKLPEADASHRDGARVVASFKVDYGNQSAIASKNGYFDVTNATIERFETDFSLSPETSDLLPQDPIVQISKGYMMKTLGINPRYLFTLEGFYNASNNSTHEFQLYRKNSISEDGVNVIRYELRHDKKGDVENQMNKRLLYSFDCSYEMTTLSEPGKRLEIELSYFNKQGILITDRLYYIYPQY